MAHVAEQLKKAKIDGEHTVRSMAQLAQVDQAQISQWMRGASISADNVRKLVESGLLTREQGVEALLGPEADVA